MGNLRQATVSQRTSRRAVQDVASQFESALHSFERDRLEVRIQRFESQIVTLPGQRFLGGAKRAAHFCLEALLRSLACWGRGTHYWLDFKLTFFELSSPFFSSQKTARFRSWPQMISSRTCNSAIALSFIVWLEILRRISDERASWHWQTYQEPAPTLARSPGLPEVWQFALTSERQAISQRGQSRHAESIVYGVPSAIYNRTPTTDP